MNVCVVSVLQSINLKWHILETLKILLFLSMQIGIYTLLSKDYKEIICITREL